MSEHEMPYSKHAIKDSGHRREFETGAKRDIDELNKGRMDLLPMIAIMELSKHCANGALKYGENNVRLGIPMNSLLDSALRHLAKYIEGYKDEDHLVSALWNIAWACQQEITRPELQNIPSRFKKIE